MTLVRFGLWSICASLVSGWLLSPVTSFAQTGDYVPPNGIERGQLTKIFIVDVPSLNFRSEPSQSGAPVSTLKRGDYLLKTDEAPGNGARAEWLKVIRGDGEEGWVSARHVRPVSDALRTVDGAAAFLTTLDSTLAALAPKSFDELQVGFLYPASISDGGWTYSHDLGRQALEQLSFVSATRFREAVPEDQASVSAAVDELVKDGSNLIFAASYGYMDPILEAAKQHPDVVFMHNSGFKIRPNTGTYFGRIYEARYLSGIVAGAVSKSNVIGFVAAFPIPEVIRGINAFTLGARSVNPEAKVQVEWTETWYGPGIERAKAETLFDRQADVIAIHQNSPAAIQVAAQRGKYAIGFHSDMSAFGPETTLTSAVWDWGVVYKQIALELREGVWDPEQLWWGMNKGVVKLTPLSDKVPDDIKNLVEQRQEEIAARRLRIFEGPIQDDKGAIRVPEGEVLGDDDLLAMDFYVLGVEGGMEPASSTIPPKARQN